MTLTPDTGTLRTKGSDLNLGAFTIKVNAGNPDKANIALTDASGDTYVYVGNQKTAATSDDKVATIVVTYSVTYSGTQSGDELAALWAASVDAHLSHGLKVTATMDNNVRFLDSASPANAAAWSGAANKVIFTKTVAELKGLTIPANNQEGGSCYVAITGQDQVETATEHTITFTPADNVA